MMEPISEVPLRADARGCVFEPVDETTLLRQRNVHVALSAPGQVRGNHYHRRSSEVMVVLGPARVRYQEPGQAPVGVVVPEGKAFRFVFAPGVRHAIEGTGTGPMIIVAFSDQLHDPAQPDTVREVLIEPR